MLLLLFDYVILAFFFKDLVGRVGIVSALRVLQVVT